MLQKISENYLVNVDHVSLVKKVDQGVDVKTYWLVFVHIKTSNNGLSDQWLQFDTEEEREIAFINIRNAK